MSEENKEFQFEELVDEFLKKRIQQYKLRLETKQIIRRIYYLKEKFRNTEPEEFSLDKGKVSLKKYISKFSSVLSKEFNKLSIEEKRKLFKTKLLKLKFGLNQYQYQKLKDDNKETPVDKYVQERKKTREFYLNADWNNNVKQELEDFKRHLELKWEIWDKEVFEDISFKDELEDEYPPSVDKVIYRQLMEEMEDPAYDSFFTDDSVFDLEETPENIEKGLLKDYPWILYNEDVFGDEED